MLTYADVCRTAVAAQLTDSSSNSSGSTSSSSDSSSDSSSLLLVSAAHVHPGTYFTCSTGTKVQILTPE